MFDAVWDMAKLLLQTLAISYNYGSNGKVINKQVYSTTLCEKHKKIDNHMIIICTKH